MADDEHLILVEAPGDASYDDVYDWERWPVLTDAAIEALIRVFAQTVGVIV